MVLQSALLGLGAYLTIKGELSAGTIIAVSVASARALAPVDLAIGNWKSFIAARMAYHRLRDTVVALAAADEPMQLPEPTDRLSVESMLLFRDYVRREGHKFLKDADAWIGEREIPRSSWPTHTPRILGVGVYYFEQDEANR